MKILVVSDSHGRNTHLERVIEKVQPKLLIHLGDLEGSEDFLSLCALCPVEMIRGNNDYYSDLEAEKLITIGRYQVLLTHGHRHGVYYGMDTLREWGKGQGADIVMFGHTHKPFLDIGSDITLLNPGSISLPRQEGRRPSYAIMELDRMGEAHFTLNFVS
jgi:hypothetical protein